MFKGRDGKLSSLDFLFPTLHELAYWCYHLLSLKRNLSSEKIEMSLTFMVVVDVAGFQAMWRVCQPADLYMRGSAGGARPLWFNFSESCFHCNVSCNQFEMSPPPPGGTMSLQLQSRPAKIRKAAKAMSFQFHFTIWLGPGFCQIETVAQLSWCQDIFVSVTFSMS